MSWGNLRLHERLGNKYKVEKENFLELMSTEQRLEHLEKFCKG